jgi:hypothetical protein
MASKIYSIEHLPNQDGLMISPAISLPPAPAARSLSWKKEQQLAAGCSKQAACSPAALVSATCVASHLLLPPQQWGSDGSDRSDARPIDRGVAGIIRSMLLGDHASPCPAAGHGRWIQRRGPASARACFGHQCDRNGRRTRRPRPSNASKLAGAGPGLDRHFDRPTGSSCPCLTAD